MKKLTSHDPQSQAAMLQGPAQGINPQSILALGWVIDALQDALHEAYGLVERQPDLQAILQARALLHQVSGTLGMTELADPLILATSLEQLAEAIASQQIALAQSQILAKGISTLQQELRFLHLNKRLQPVTIYRMIKVVRQQLEARKLTTPQTYPHLDYHLLLAPNQVQSLLDSQQWQAGLQVYRHLISQFLQQDTDQAVLDNLSRVSAHMASGASTVEQAALWNVLAKLHSAMANREVDGSALIIKHGMVHVERMLAHEQFDEQVLFELLELFELFDLKHNFAIHQQALVAALGEDQITSPLVLDKIVLMLHNIQRLIQQSQGQRLTADIPHLLDEAIHLLTLTGWQDMADELSEIRSDFNLAEDGKIPADAVSRLVHVETRLQQLVSAFDIHADDYQEYSEQDMVHEAKSAAIREMRAALENIKTTFFNFVSSRQNTALLAEFSAQFTDLKGVLGALNLQRAATLVSRFVAVLEETLLDTDHPLTGYQIDLIAENICSLEYYLDQVASHFHDEQLLIKFEMTLDKLAQPAPSEKKVPVTGGEKLFYDDMPLGLLDRLEPADNSIPTPLASAPPEPPSASSDLPGPDLSSPDLTSPDQAHTQLQNPLGSAAADIAHDYAKGHHTGDGLTHPAIEHMPRLVDEFSQDEDIREIFVEEATEVLGTLREKFPVWKQRLDDLETLKEVRRAFHTLKGSGRMVGSMVSGELAWTIENLLNRVLDHSIVPTSEVLQLIEQVLAIYPQLIADYAQGVTTLVETRPLMAIANALSKAEPLGHEDMAWLTQSVPAVSADSATQQAEQAEQHLLQPESEQATGLQDEISAMQRIHDDEQEGIAIFVEEAEEHLDTLHQFIASPELHHDEVPDSVLRALHTLRGSAAMSSVEPVHRLATSFEEAFKRLVRLHQPLDQAHAGLLAQFVQCVGTHLEALQAGHRPSMEHCDHDLMQQVAALEQASSTAEADIYPGSAPVAQPQVIAHFLELGINELLDAEYELEAKMASSDASEYLNLLCKQSQALHAAALNTAIVPLQTLMQALSSIYLQLGQHNRPAIDATQTDTLLNAHFALTQIFDCLAANQKPLLDSKVIESLNDLLLSLANAPADAATSGNGAASQWPASQTPARDDSSAQAAALSPFAVGTPAADQDMVFSTALVARANPDATRSGDQPPAQLAAERVTDHQIDTELLDIFLEEADELINEIDRQFEEWQRQPQQLAPLMVLQRHLHTLKGGARMAQIASLGDLGHELETVYERLVNRQLQSSPALIQFMRHAQDVVAEQVEQLGSKQTSFFARAEYEALVNYLQSGNDQILADFNARRVATPQAVIPVAPDTAATPPGSSAAPPLSSEFDTRDIIKPQQSPKDTSISRLATESRPASLSPPDQAMPVAPLTDTPQASYIRQADWSVEHQPDPQVLAVFIEEAAEQVDSSHKLLQRWLKNNQDKRALLELQRSLHTLKGSARMSGVPSIATLAHELEFVYEELANNLVKGLSGIAVELLHGCHDWLADAVATLKQQKQPLEPDNLIVALQRLRSDPDSLTSLPPVSTQTPDAEAQQAQTLFEQVAVTETVGDGTEPPSMYGVFQAANQGEQIASNEMIRVSAATLEKMINLAGENAINRARIEMGVNNFGYVLDEMGLTIARLAEQLRRMEGELESQILARHEQERGHYADFDPLEMDQYSALNQLSKSLAESASDLVDFKVTLSERIRDTENLLLQQSRIQSELQDGLMNSRLVPFSRLLPRLQRVVRQTSAELNKPAELIVNNAEGELDRTVLDRMVAPLEHMLRNAVDHGLETAEQRQAANKPLQGQIRLGIERQGNEIIITLEDDGRGIDIKAVRAKAIERGLLAPDAKLSHYDIMQFIFNAGLSTAQKLTQISGRGVGMDVVQNEIKLLGGTVSVDSHQGQGTRISMRLPLTVAVTDALMVRVGDRQFAIPLSQIERIVRVSPVALEQYYQSSQESFNIDSQSYRLRYLGEFIHAHKMPHLTGQGMSLPVLLLKSMGQPTAIQVDQLVGSRAEIVVKPAGQQLTGIDMISGATILGDGSVTIILDAIALARRAAASKRIPALDSQKATVVREASRKTLVMVVDDSVTVRKVTTRILERQGYEVITAKDGVDAMEKLEELTPDIMLLDIEMPRMDGFEVATLVRHNQAIADLPIIMITSRTGEKHRERAFLTGVNCYMGKPFQEAELLQNIDEILTTHVAGSSTAR